MRNLSRRPYSSVNILSNLFILGTWIVKDIYPNTEGKAQKVKVKVRINLHGIMTVSSASLYESKESPEPETPSDQQKQELNDNDQHKNENVADGPPEVGSSWTKKISAWFSGVRISI